MSTNVTDLTIEQAILLAIASIRKSQDIIPVAELAERAGITRQYLYRLANKRIEQEDKEKPLDDTRGQETGDANRPTQNCTSSP